MPTSDRLPPLATERDGHGEIKNAIITDTVQLRIRFIVSTLLFSCMVAFCAGRVARIRIHNDAERNSKTCHETASQLAVRLKQEGVDVDLDLMILPDPVVKMGKLKPRTTYTSKNFDTGSASTHSRWIVTDWGKQHCVSKSDGAECTPTPPSATVAASDPVVISDNISEEVHMPSGQHLLIDIENVDKIFLNTEERLANAMVKLVDECDLTLLSYHCHKLHPSGVSCAGVLLESHVSFHTWPTKGVISIDLFTCGPKSLLPIVPIVESLFAIPTLSLSEDDSRPKMVWAHKYRGFGDHSDAAEMTDMFHFPVGQMSDFKQEVVSATTKYQRMDVYDVLRPGVQSLELYHKSLQNDGSYESQHRDLFAPDRIVFLDGVLQSRRSGDAAYHETLVHPAMFAHRHPKRVAIIGGGEGATLREVLKHNTVEKVVMIDIDEQMVELSRKFLSFWSDCSVIALNTQSCFSDPRVETYYEDAFQWFIDRFSSEHSEQKAEPFDIIIMDALDPQVQKEFADTLYERGAPVFTQGLRDDGVLVAQVGEANTIHSPSSEFSINKNKLTFIETLASLGFKAVQDFEESHNGFERPWDFIIAYKDVAIQPEWFATSAMVDLKIRKRGKCMVEGGPPFFYFDGTTMESYKYPSKGSEVSFCRQHADFVSCHCKHGLQKETSDPVTVLHLEEDYQVNVPQSRFSSSVASKCSSSDGIEALFASFLISPHTVALATRLKERLPWVYDFYWGSNMRLLTTTCKSPKVTEQNHILRGEEVIYNPARERQGQQFLNAVGFCSVSEGKYLNGEL